MMRSLFLKLWVPCALLVAPLLQPSVGAASSDAVQVEEAVSSSNGSGWFSVFWSHEPYQLDPVARYLDSSEPLVCDAPSMVLHKSKLLRYTVRVHPAFQERLARFDAFVRELATEHYGRAPRKLMHRGAFVCRSTRGRQQRVSEHALGNALDFVGLEFGPMPRKASAPESMPPAMRRAFSVRVQAHWSPRRKADAHHARFLHRLAEELRARPDIFHGIVGPPRPRHHDHLHFDVAPWRYALFGYEPLAVTECLGLSTK